MNFASVPKRVTAVTGNVASSGKEDDGDDSAESGSEEDDDSENEDLNEENYKEAPLDKMGLPKSGDDRKILRRCSLGDIKRYRVSATQAARTELLTDFQFELALKETARGVLQQTQEVKDSDEVLVQDVDGEVDEPKIEINRTSDEARKSAKSNKKRRAGEVLERHYDDASFECPRKKRRFNRERRLAFLIEVDRDSDTKTDGSTWR